jgi:outer membrane protein TolC
MTFSRTPVAIQSMSLRRRALTGCAIAAALAVFYAAARGFQSQQDSRAGEARGGTVPPGGSGAESPQPAAGGPSEGDVAKRWIDADDPRLRSEAPDLSHWWTVFNDPVLEALIRDAHEGNLALKAAAARLSQAGGPRGAGAEDPWCLAVVDYNDVLVTVLADVATVYVQARQAQQQIALARGNAKFGRWVLDLVQDLHRVGHVGDSDIAEAKTCLADVEATIPQFNTALRRAENRLCVLLGRPPCDLSARLGVTPIPAAPVEAVVGTPAQLLARRPDIRRAQRHAAAHPGDQEVLLTYRQTVLAANQEVEDSIATFLWAQERGKLRADGAAAAEKAVKQFIDLYRMGVRGADFRRVAVGLEQLARQQDAMAQSQAQVALGLISVYRALGGGWEVPASGAGVQKLVPPTAPGPASMIKAPSPPGDDGAPVPAPLPPIPPVPASEPALPSLPTPEAAPTGKPLP